MEVGLKGNDPLSCLSNVFRDGRNEFLVYGYEENVESKTKNVSTLDNIENPYTIIVDSWEIIIPIYRDYTYSSYGRFFYPKRYIDSYDMEHEDYKYIK